MPKKLNFLTIFVVLLCFGLAVSLAELFSSVITIGDFAFLPSSQAKSGSFCIYALAFYKTTDESSTSELAKKIQTKNGAGYIYNKDNVYYILASAYESENDAKKVLEKNETDEFTGEIIKIEVKEINLNMTLSGKEKIALSNSLSIFKKVYASLYDLSVSLDTEVKNQTECKLAISDLKSNVSKVQADFDAHFNGKLDKNLLNIKLKLSDLSKMLQELLEKDSDGISFSSKLKYDSIEAITLNVDVCDAMN